MRIGIDARMFGFGFGLARYIQQLVLHLENIDQENEYIVFMKRDNWNLFIPKNKNFTKVLADVAWYGFAEQIFFPKIIKAQKLDVMHFPHFNVPVLYTGSFVVTIHDLIMFHYPRTEASTHGPLVYWIKDVVHRFVVQRATRRAQHIFVTSEFTKRDVHETLRVPNDKMTVTYQAPFALENIKLPETDNAVDILKTYTLTKPYILYVGAAYPHKNLMGLLQGWKIFQKKYGDAYQLVLVGKENFFYTKLKDLIQKEYSDVIYTGFLPDNTLSLLYKHAALYVFPSLYEGFGIPPLEAMTHGVPVVSSNKSCLPEVLQDAALYFDPENQVEMADTIYKGITDESLRQDLREKARTLLLRYSWQELALQTRAFYSVLSKDK